MPISESTPVRLARETPTAAIDAPQPKEETATYKIRDRVAKGVEPRMTVGSRAARHAAPVHTMLLSQERRRTLWACRIDSAT
jgi:hypothetical protein